MGVEFQQVRPFFPPYGKNVNDLCTNFFYWGTLVANKNLSENQFPDASERNTCDINGAIEKATKWFRQETQVSY